MLRPAVLLSTLTTVLSYGVPMVGHRAPQISVRSALLRAQMPSSPQIVSEETYGMMLTTLLKTNKSVTGEISANYAMVDYAFLEKLYAQPHEHAPAACAC